MTVSNSKSDEPKRSDYGSVSVEEVGDVDNSYCTEYELPDYPTISDYLTYPYRCGVYSKIICKASVTFALSLQGC